jgi:hypothetical protein
MSAEDELQEREWEALFADLGELLRRYGAQHPFGEGDFWIVDDNWGSPEHKVCVTRLPFLTRVLAADVQRLLQKYSLPWAVLFSLDDPKLRPTEADRGVLVRKTGIEEHWDRERMKSAFGDDFRWLTGVAPPSGEGLGEFARRVFQTLMLWFLGSTLVGMVLGGSWGHGGAILMLAAWLLGAVGFLVHLIVLLRARKRPLSQAG